MYKNQFLYKLVMNKWNVKEIVILSIKQVQDLYEVKPQNPNKIKEKLSRDITCSYIGRVDIVNMSVFSILVYRFKAVSIKVEASYHMDSNEQILKFTWRDRRLRRANTILMEKNKVEGLTPPDLRDLL